MLYLIAFVANDIIDQEPWKLLSVDSVDHLKRVEIRLLCKKVQVASYHLAIEDSVLYVTMLILPM